MEDSQAAGKWKTEQGGEYFAAGVGGAITGRGADLSDHRRSTQRTRY